MWRHPWRLVQAKNVNRSSSGTTTVPLTTKPGDLVFFWNASRNANMYADGFSTIGYTSGGGEEQRQMAYIVPKAGLRSVDCISSGHGNNVSAILAVFRHTPALDPDEGYAHYGHYLVGHRDNTRAHVSELWVPKGGVFIQVSFTALYNPATWHPPMRRIEYNLNYGYGNAGVSAYGFWADHDMRFRPSQRSGGDSGQEHEATGKVLLLP